MYPVPLGGTPIFILRAVLSVLQEHIHCKLLLNASYVIQEHTEQVTAHQHVMPVQMENILQIMEHLTVLHVSVVHIPYLDQVRAHLVIQVISTPLIDPVTALNALQGNMQNIQARQIVQHVQRVISLRMGTRYAKVVLQGSIRILMALPRVVYVLFLGIPRKQEAANANLVP